MIYAPFVKLWVQFGYILNFGPFLQDPIHLQTSGGRAPALPPQQVSSTLLLLVLRILADDHDAALALDDLALFADGLNGRSHFHDDSTSYLHRIAPAVQPCG